MLTQLVFPRTFVVLFWWPVFKIHLFLPSLNVWHSYLLSCKALKFGDVSFNLPWNVLQCFCYFLFKSCLDIWLFVKFLIFFIILISKILWSLNIIQHSLLLEPPNYPSSNSSFDSQVRPSEKETTSSICSQYFYPKWPLFLCYILKLFIMQKSTAWGVESVFCYHEPLEI